MAASENEDRKTDDQETEVSLDMSQAQIKRMIAEARERGYITYDQLNTVLPPDQVSSEQIEDVMSMLSEMGINIIEDDEVEDEDAAQLIWSQPAPRMLLFPRAKQKSWIAPMTPCACTCAKWDLLNCSAVRARLPLPSGSRPGAIQ